MSFTTDKQAKPFEFQIPPTHENTDYGTFEEPSLDQLVSMGTAESMDALNAIAGVERRTELTQEAHAIADDTIQLGYDDLGPNALLEADAALNDANRVAQTMGTERMVARVESPIVLCEFVGKAGAAINQMRDTLILRQDQSEIDALRLRSIK